MTIDFNVEPIEFEDINKIKVVSNIPVLNKLSLFIQKVAPKINLEYDEILIAIGAKDGKYSTKLLQESSKWSLLTDEEKADKLKENDKIDVKKLELIAKEQKDRIFRFLNSPMLLVQTLFINGVNNETGEPQGLIDEFLDLLVLATKYNKEITINKSRLFISDGYILSELFTRIILKQQGMINDSFFIKQIGSKLTNLSSILSFMKNVALNTKNKE